MDDLPTPASQGNNQINQLSNNPIQSVGGMQKEVEIGGLRSAETGLLDVGTQEIEISKEVASVGVKVQPTVVQLPQAVTQMGVTPVGQMGLPQAPAAALPLTETQIVLGLKQSITSSWRWLAEWCVRKLKQLHKTIHA